MASLLAGGNDEQSRSDHLQRRFRYGLIWHCLIFAATLIAVFALTILLFNIINGAFGFVAITNTVDPKMLVQEIRPGSDVELHELERSELLTILNKYVRKGRLSAIEADKPLSERKFKALVRLVVDIVVEPRVQKSWSLWDSIFSKKDIFAYAENQMPGSWIQFRSWVNMNFLTSDLSNVPENAGLRTPIIGSLMVIVITILFSFPVGVGTAVYLEEFARDSKLNRFVQLNIYNLSGVPSIIYGLLGLAIFVRILGPLTSGAVFGLGSDGGMQDGRTIVSAGLTLGILILPIIIINAQEAIRAIPKSLRDSSYGLGATKWQTIWHHVLPASMDRILTGTIIAVSRALGETAPLVVIGASGFLTRDPASIFDKFTTLPIMIYRWTSYPQAEFRNIAAAAIIILLAVLLSMNAIAIILRERISRKRKR